MENKKMLQKNCRLPKGVVCKLKEVADNPRSQSMVIAAGLMLYFAQDDENVRKSAKELSHSDSIEQGIEQLRSEIRAAHETSQIRDMIASLSQDQKMYLFESARKVSQDFPEK